MRILCSEENSDKARKKKILIRQYSSTVQYNKSVQPRRTVTNANPDVGGGVLVSTELPPGNLTQKYEDGQFRKFQHFTFLYLNPTHVIYLSHNK